MKKLFVCLIFLISFSNAIQCYNGKTYVDIPESKLSDIGYTKYNITHSKFDCKIAYKRYLKIKEIEPVNVYQVTESEKVEEVPSKICLLYLCFLVIIVCVIWIIKNAVKDEPQDERYSVTKQKETVSVKKEQEKFWNDLSKYSENLEQVKTQYIKSLDDLSKEYSENLSNVYHKNKTYEELLTRQEWYNFRSKVINDRGYICEFCKKKHNLQIHHKLYYKKPDKEKIEPWLYNMDEVLLLCDNCHKSIHKKNKIKVYYISYADYNNRKVWFYNDFKQS